MVSLGKILEAGAKINEGCCSGNNLPDIGSGFSWPNSADHWSDIPIQQDVKWADWGKVEGEEPGLSSVYKRRVEPGNLYGNNLVSTVATPVSGFFTPRVPSSVSPIHRQQSYSPSPDSPLHFQQSHSPSPISPLHFQQSHSPSPVQSLHLHQHLNHQHQQSSQKQQEFPFPGFGPPVYSQKQQNNLPGGAEGVQDKVNNGFFPQQIFVQYPNSPLLSHPAPEKERRNIVQREQKYQNFEREKENISNGPYQGVGSYRQPVKPLSRPAEHQHLYNNFLGQRKEGPERERERERSGRPLLQGRRPDQDGPRPERGVGASLFQPNFRAPPTAFQQGPRRNFKPLGKLSETNRDYSFVIH